MMLHRIFSLVLCLSLYSPLSHGGEPASRHEIRVQASTRPIDGDTFSIFVDYNDRHNSFLTDETDFKTRICGGRESVYPVPEGQCLRISPDAKLKILKNLQDSIVKLIPQLESKRSPRLLIFIDSHGSLEHLTHEKFGEIGYGEIFYSIFWPLHQIKNGSKLRIDVHINACKAHSALPSLKNFLSIQNDDGEPMYPFRINLMSAADKDNICHANELWDDLQVIRKAKLSESFPGPSDLWAIENLKFGHDTTHRIWSNYQQVPNTMDPDHLMRVLRVDLEKPSSELMQHAKVNPNLKAIMTIYSDEAWGKELKRLAERAAEDGAIKDFEVYKLVSLLNREEQFPILTTGLLSKKNKVDEYAFSRLAYRALKSENDDVFAWGIENLRGRQIGAYHLQVIKDYANSTEQKKRAINFIQSLQKELLTGYRGNWYLGMRRSLEDILLACRPNSSAEFLLKELSK